MSQYRTECESCGSYEYHLDGNGNCDYCAEALADNEE